MAKRQNQKLKIPYLEQMLMEETDDQHGLTMPQIIERLAEHGINAERKSVYDDIAVLRDFGLDIIVRHGATTEYAIGAREFEFPELLLMVDAVQSSRFLTERKSAALVNRIKKLASVHQAEQLDKRMHVEGRIKMQNESIYYNVDAIQRAILLKKRISFRYFAYDVNKDRLLRHKGQPYEENPICLVYSDDYYYLITFNDKHGDFVRYRVDRMLEIEVTDEPITRNERIANFDVEQFSARAFGMFDGEPVTVQMLVECDVIGAIIDRFGKDTDMKKVDERNVRVHVPVLKSSVFFGWLAQFGTQMRIEKPEAMASEYRDYLRQIADSYDR